MRKYSVEGFTSGSKRLRRIKRAVKRRWRRVLRYDRSWLENVVLNWKDRIVIVD